MNQTSRNSSENCKQALETLKSRLFQIRSSVYTRFKQSVCRNQATKSDLSSLHLKSLNKLDEGFRQSVQRLEEFASENFAIKDRSLLKLEETETKLKNLEEFFMQNDELPLADYHEIFSFLKNLEENVRFKSLFVKDSSVVEELGKVFLLTDREIEKKDLVQWFFVENGTSEERMFEKTIEMQLERGFHSNSSKYKLFMKGQKDCFGVVFYESMKMIVYNPRKEFTVIRRALSC